MIALTALKGEDYTAGNKDQLANFRTGGAWLGLHSETVWWVYAYKHWMAITEYCRRKTHNEQHVASEPILERVDDLILYLILLKGIIIDGTEQGHLLDEPGCPGCGAQPGNLHLPNCNRDDLIPQGK